MDPNVSLRPEQVERLAQYIHHGKFLDLSDPGTGKTPPVCVFLWYQWSERGKVSLWSQPKSLLGKNRREVLRFTDFKPDDVVILETDWAPITGPTNLPTMERVKEEQYADEVIIQKPGTTPTRKGDIVPFELIERMNEVVETPATFQFNWINVVTKPGDSGLELGTPITSTMLGKVNKALGAEDKAKIKARRTFHKRPIVTRVIDTIAAAKATGAKVILCSFHFMRNHWQRLIEVFPEIDCLAVDELHMGYGGIDSQNTHSMWGVMSHASSFIGMTGTLLNGKLDSVYPAITVVEPNYYPMGYSSFRADHVAFEDEYGRVLSWKNEAKVGQILLNHGIRRTFEEVYGKEDVAFLPDLVDMGPKMRAEYDLFHEQAMLELGDGTFLDGSLPGVATIRARQIIAHPETMGLCQDEETGKDERLRIHIEDARQRGESTLIFSVHTAEQERIQRQLRSWGRRVGLMNGETSTRERQRIDEEFVARRIDDVVGSPQTMAVGWNWEHVDHVIAISLTYNDVDWLQAYRRASRGTRKKTLRVTLMQYADSIDGRVLDIIHQKSVLANRVDPSRPVLKLAA